MVGSIIRDIRIERGLSQVEVARVLNVQPQLYNSYELNVNLPDIYQLSRLADYFDISTDYLLGRSDLQKNNLLKASGVFLNQEENQLIEMYRKLPPILQAEIRGEIKGILRASSSTVSPSQNTNNKKAI